MFTLIETSRTIAELGFLAALMLNSLLIYLTNWRAENITGPYKSMIIFCALLGVGFSCVEMTARPFAHNYNGAFIYFSLATGNADWKPVTALLLAVYAGTYAAMISSITVLFIYRFMVLVQPNYLKYLFLDWRIIIWIFYIAIFGVAWAALVYYCGYPDEVSQAYIQQEFESIYKMDINKTAVFIVLAYDKNPDNTLRWSSVLCIAGTVSILITQYIIMAICGTSMHIQMNEKLKNFSLIHQRLHKQFFKTLVIQITVPTILFHMPVLPILVTPFFNTEVSLQTGIAYSLFSLYPPIDSLIIMCVVSDYRSAMNSEFRLVIKLKRDSGLIGRPESGASVSALVPTGGYT